MQARIFQKGKSATQSGRSQQGNWILEYMTDHAKVRDPLTGHVASHDMMSQVKLNFASQEQAEAYAKRNGLLYYIDTSIEDKPKRVSYSDNFRHTRFMPWTH